MPKCKVIYHFITIQCELKNLVQICCDMNRPAQGFQNTMCGTCAPALCPFIGKLDIMICLYFVAIQFRSHATDTIVMILGMPSGILQDGQLRLST